MEVSERLDAEREREVDWRLVVTVTAEVGVSKGLGVAASGARGGTICTWRLSGWFDIEGGGRTNMKV